MSWSISGSDMSLEQDLEHEEILTTFQGERSVPNIDSHHEHIGSQRYLDPVCDVNCPPSRHFGEMQGTVPGSGRLPQPPQPDYTRNYSHPVPPAWPGFPGIWAAVPPNGMQTQYPPQYMYSTPQGANIQPMASSWPAFPLSMPQVPCAPFTNFPNPAAPSHMQPDQIGASRVPIQRSPSSSTLDSSEDDHITIRTKE